MFFFDVLSMEDAALIVFLIEHRTLFQKAEAIARGLHMPDCALLRFCLPLVPRRLKGLALNTL